MPTLRVTPADLDRFAALSHDRNPLHVDEAYARRTPFGERVVFGVLSALRAIATLRTRAAQRLQKITLDFSGPVLAGVEYAIHASEQDAKATVRVLDGPRTLLRATLVFEAGEPTTTADLASTPTLRSTAAVRGPAELPEGTRWSGVYAAAGLAAFMRELGLAERGLAAGHVVAILASTYVVGMELPGDRALFTRLELTFSGEPRSAFDVEAVVREYDDRFSLLTLELRMGALHMGGATPFCEGEARAIVRRPPIEVDRDRICAAVGADRRFAGRTALVVGGSRGLGAAAGLALAAMGARVVVTYAKSAGVAQALGLDARACDAADPSAMSELAASLRQELGGLDVVVLAASPAVLPMTIDAQNAARAADFVARSLSLVATPLGALLPLLEAKRGTALVVSSVYVEQPAAEFPHYVAAKTAIEGYAKALAAGAKHARVVTFRAPRFLSDMTNLGSTEGMQRVEDVAVRLLAEIRA